MEELLGRPVEMALVRREMRRQLSVLFDLTLESVNLEQLADRVGECGVGEAFGHYPLCGNETQKEVSAIRG